MDRVDHEGGMIGQNETQMFDTVIESRRAKGQATSSCNSTPPKPSVWVVCITKKPDGAEREGLAGHNDGGQIGHGAKKWRKELSEHNGRA